MLAFLARLKESWRMFGLFFSSAMLILLVFGVLPTGTYLLAYVEGQYSRPRDLPGDVTGIIVLGGAVDPSVSSVRGIPVINAGLSGYWMVSGWRANTPMPSRYSVAAVHCGFKTRIPKHL